MSILFYNFSGEIHLPDQVRELEIVIGIPFFRQALRAAEWNRDVTAPLPADAWFGQGQCWVGWIWNESRRRLSALNQMEQEGAEKAETDGPNDVRESHSSASSAISCSNLGIMLAERRSAGAARLWLRDETETQPRRCLTLPCSAGVSWRICSWNGKQNSTWPCDTTAQLSLARWSVPPYRAAQILSVEQMNWSVENLCIDPARDVAIPRSKGNVTSTSDAESRLRYG